MNGVEKISLQTKVLFSLLVLSLVLTIFTGNVYALVIGTPIILLSAFKVSVFLVSVMAVPVTAFFRIVKGSDRKKAIFLAAATLSIVFALAFVGVKSISSGTSDKVSDIDGIVPFGEDRPAAEFAPADPLLPTGIQPGSGLRPNYPLNISALLPRFGIFAGIITAVLFVPVLIVLLAIKKIAGTTWNNRKLISGSLYFCLSIGLMISFVLTLFLAVTSGRVQLI